MAEKYQNGDDSAPDKCGNRCKTQDGEQRSRRYKDVMGEVERCFSWLPGYRHIAGEYDYPMREIIFSMIQLARII